MIAAIEALRQGADLGCTIAELEKDENVDTG